MNKRPVIRYAAAIAALCAFVMAVRVSYTTAERREGLARVLPGAPLPEMDYSGLFGAPAPVQKVSEALATPLQAAAKSLRPLAQAFFPSFWDAPTPQGADTAYSVRDTALRVVKESL